MGSVSALFVEARLPSTLKHVAFTENVALRKLGFWDKGFVSFNAKRKLKRVFFVAGPRRNGTKQDPNQLVACYAHNSFEMLV